MGARAVQYMALASTALMCTTANAGPGKLCTDTSKAMDPKELITRVEAGEKHFRVANLHHAVFPQARLFGIDLWNANLCGADLRQAQLAGANLSGADLREALLDGNL